MRVRELRYARLFNFPGRYENERIEVVIELDENEDTRAAWAKAYDLVHKLHEVGEVIRRFNEICDEAWSKQKHLAKAIRDAEETLGRYLAKKDELKRELEEQRAREGKIARRLLCELGDVEDRIAEARKTVENYKKAREWYAQVAKRAEELALELDKVMRDADFAKVSELVRGPIAELLDLWTRGPDVELPDWW